MRRERRLARVDDEDFDDDVYDARYYPRRIVKDGKGITVPIYLADGMPPEYRAVASRAAARSDARTPDVRWHYPPRFFIGDTASFRDAERQADEARQAYLARLNDAWRTPPGQAVFDQNNGNGDDDEDEEDRDGEGETARDLYIKRLGSAWKQTGPYLWTTPGPRMLGPQREPPIPYGRRNSDVSAVEKQRQAWISPGAEPGAAGGGPRKAPATFGQNPDPLAPPGPRYVGGQRGLTASSRDAASLTDGRAEAAQAYDEMVDRLENAWRT